MGHALWRGLAEAGIDVIASSRSEEGVQEVSKLIGSLGRKTLVKTVDVMSRGSIGELH